MFVTFYKAGQKIDFMVEMQTVPCVGDRVIIGGELNKVIKRTFSVDKPSRCRCDVARCYDNYKVL